METTYKRIVGYGLLAKDSFELVVEVSGWSYLVIYGTHVNGGFCAIPNHNISSEMGDPDNVNYNAEKLSRIEALDYTDAHAIACGINDYYLFLKEQLQGNDDGYLNKDCMQGVGISIGKECL